MKSRKCGSVLELDRHSMYRVADCSGSASTRT